jgi:GLPGLI family protein
MKRTLLLIGILVSLAAAQIVFGQTSGAQQGVISYETSVNMHRNLPPERQDMKAMMPEYRTTKEQLVFNDQEFMYKPVIEDEEEPFANNGGAVQIRMRPMQEFHVNKESRIRLTQQELNGKKYIVEDTLKMSPWKFGTETREILGYTCKQAYYTHTEETQGMRFTAGNTAPTMEKRTVVQEITVWYTEQLPAMMGPDRFCTLPGTVLAVDINNGERVIVAKKVDLREIKKNELKAPTTGTKITRAEFQKMMEEQLQRMRAAGGNVFIRN